MLLDIIIEVSAPRFDFWEFENSIIPIKNYIAWFVIGSIAHYLYRQTNIKTNKKLSIHIFVAKIFIIICFIN
jgi:putative membrane protein